MPPKGKHSLTNPKYATHQLASIQFQEMQPPKTRQINQTESKLSLPNTKVDGLHANKYLNAYTQVGLLLSPPKVTPCDMRSTSNNIIRLPYMGRKSIFREKIIW
jgi:hypothetical protein